MRWGLHPLIKNEMYESLIDVGSLTESDLDVTYHWCGHGRSKKEENYLDLSKGCCISDTFYLFEHGMCLLYSETVSSTWAEMMACKKVGFERNWERKIPFRFTLLIFLGKSKKWKREVTSGRKCVLLEFRNILFLIAKNDDNVGLLSLPLATENDMRCQISQSLYHWNNNI